MLTGDDKARSIARSVLPAGRNRAQTAAKDKRNASQHRRTRARQDISDIYHVGARASDVIEEFDGGADLWIDTYNPEEKGEVRDIVMERRLADTLGPITRWTRAKSKEITDPVELMSFVADMLPNDLAGRHALGHMRQEFGPEDTSYYRYRPKVTDKYRVALEYALWEHMVIAVFEADHKGLNRAIKANAKRYVQCGTKDLVKRRMHWNRYCGHYETKREWFSWQKRYVERTYWVRNIIDVPDWYAETVHCDACGEDTKVSTLRPIRDLSEVTDLIKRLRDEDTIQKWIQDRYRQIERKMAA